MNILYVMDLLGDGGVERMTLQWVKNIVNDEIQIDFVVRDVDNKENERFLLEKGCKIYKMPYSYRQFFKRKKLLTFVFNKKKYDIIHVHGAVGADYPIYKWAKDAGIPVRIAHSHNANYIFQHWYSGLIHRVTKGLIRKYATTFLGCSKDACEFYYGGVPNSIVISNGIDTEVFRFDKEQREEIRKKYHVEERIIYGSIGRCEKQKNQEFLLEIYKEILKLQSNAYFLLIGHGSLEKNVEKKIEELGLTNYLIWIKQTSEINLYMSMMDVFILPSLYEGLGVVGVEAQSMGLPILISDEAYHEELDLTKLLNKMKLSCCANEWARKCVALSFQRKIFIREDFHYLIEKSGYSINASAECLRGIYISEFKRIKNNAAKEKRKL